MMSFILQIWMTLTRCDLMSCQKKKCIACMSIFFFFWKTLKKLRYTSFLTRQGEVCHVQFCCFSFCNFKFNISVLNNTSINLNNVEECGLNWQLKLYSYMNGFDVFFSLVSNLLAFGYLCRCKMFWNDVKLLNWNWNQNAVRNCM